MSDLDAVGAEFKKWKGNLAYCRYPTHLWDKVHKLKDHYSLQAIASALGMSVQYLERKLKMKSVSFAPLQVTSIPSPVKIEFKHITVQAHESQLASILQALVEEI